MPSLTTTFTLAGSVNRISVRTARVTGDPLVGAEEGAEQAAASDDPGQDVSRLTTCRISTVTGDLPEPRAEAAPGSSAVFWPVADPVTHADDAFDVPDRVDQVKADGAALHLAGDRHDGRFHGHIERVRVEREVPGDDFPDHLVADLAVSPVEDAQHVHPAHDPASRCRPRPAAASPGGLHQLGRLATLAAGPIVIAGLLISSAAVTPAAFAPSPAPARRYQGPAPSGEGFGPSLLERKYSEIV